MPQSMTGFGRAQRQAGEWSVTAEVRSVNHRFLKAQLRLPPHLVAREGELEAVLRRRLRRGSVSVTVSSRRLAADARGRIDEELAAAYRATLARLGLPDVTVPLLPGVVTVAEAPAPSDEEWQLTVATLDAALDELCAMRAAEGAALAAALEALLGRIAELTRELEARAPTAVREAQERLTQRLAALLAGAEAQLDAQLLAREVAVLADKSDIREELDRLGSHLAQGRQRLARGDDVGRGLDFLVQEMAREASTIGAKSADAGISALVVELKLTIEQLKEQAANLE